MSERQAERLSLDQSHSNQRRSQIKIVIVTGGSRGIGASAARICAAKGMGVILTYNSSLQCAHEVVGLFGRFAEGAAEALRMNFGLSDFDFLVNNAGYGLFAPITDVTKEQFDGLFNVHLKGPLFLTQTLLPLMANGGHIVNMTSATTRVAFLVSLPTPPSGAVLRC